MQTSVLMDVDKAIVKLVGRFDFNTHRDFRSAYEPLVADAAVRSVTVDFSSVDYLDSSALGMLLMLRDRFSGANKEVALSGVRGNVKQVLDIANFNKLFQISEY
jgi:HptB-dependent secretion and biofilm anti anti-sigma factor